MSNDLLADVIWKSIDLAEPDDFEFKDIGELVWVKAILGARTDKAPNLERLLSYSHHLDPTFGSRSEEILPVSY
jgi:hypothetical protein